MSNVKKFNQRLAEDHRAGLRLDEEFAELNFRSRKNPKQSCYIPDDAVTEHGVYYTILGCGWPRPFRRGKKNADW